MPVVGNVATYAFDVTSISGPEAVLSPPSLAFGGQSMGTTAPPQTITVTNIGSGTLTISSISASAQFGQTNDCSTLTEGQHCTVTVTFTPSPGAGPLNSTTNVNGTLSVVSDGAGSPTTATLQGTGEKSLVTHYYRSILGRSPDAGGKSFWEGEAVRMESLTANVNETWFAMATFFYFSPEYVSLGRSNAGFVTDLYNTFFNRPPDAGGLAFWTDQLTSGMPREVVLVSFMFSPEFASFTQGIFGNTAARAEVDVVMDFYRGLVARLPDGGGFNHWVGQFRTAQCQGAGEVYAQVHAISSTFVNGGEYAARNRTNAQFVGDMYNAFLRRGGDAGGVNFWINQLNSGMSREEVRQAFVSTPEFTNRVNAIVSQGCFS